jgi:hypothetical protein
MKTFEEKDYGAYIEQDFRYRWLRQDHLYHKLTKYEGLPCYSIKTIGKSAEGREVKKITWGNGPVKLLCWSQMHGNEPTATMAIIDILNFLSANDVLNEYRQQLAQELTVAFIPMLNPDGAETFNRRNSLGIDPNRDALAQQTAEIQNLFKAVDDLKPQWCFNLHDQRNIFSAGSAANTATISFLAASADIEKKLTQTRKLSMSLIGLMHQAITKMLPHHVGRYTDEYYHRALGEHFHKNDIPCVLVESGAYPGDPMRDMARKANFIALIKAFEAIAFKQVNHQDTKAYFNIPENEMAMLDIIVRDCQIEGDSGLTTVDLGLLVEEKPNFKTHQLENHFILHDIGDLQFQYGIIEQQGGLLTSPYGELKLNAPANFSVTLTDNSTIIFKNGAKQ